MSVVMFGKWPRSWVFTPGYFIVGDERRINMKITVSQAEVIPN